MNESSALFRSQVSHYVTLSPTRIYADHTHTHSVSQTQFTNSEHFVQRRRRTLPNQAQANTEMNARMVDPVLLLLFINFLCAQPNNGPTHRPVVHPTFKELIHPLHPSRGTILLLLSPLIYSVLL